MFALPLPCFPEGRTLFLSNGEAERERRRREVNQRYLLSCVDALRGWMSSAQSSQPCFLDSLESLYGFLHVISLTFLSALPPFFASALSQASRRFIYPWIADSLPRIFAFQRHLGLLSLWEQLCTAHFTAYTRVTLISQIVEAKLWFTVATLPSCHKDRFILITK